MNRPLKVGLTLFIVLFLMVVVFGLKNEVTTTDMELPIREDELQQKAEEIGEIFPTKKEDDLKEQVEKFDEVLKVGEATFTLHGSSTAHNVGGVYGENAKDRFLILNMSILNEGIEPLLIDPSLFELVVDDSQFFLVDGVASIYANTDSDFFMYSINSEMENSGYIVFDLPEGYHDSMLTLKVSDGLWGENSGEISIK